MRQSIKSIENDTDKIDLAVDAIIQAHSSLNPYEDLLSYNGVYHNIKMILLSPIIIMRILWIVLMILFGFIFSAIANEKQMLRYFPLWPRLILFGFGFYNIPVKNHHILQEAKNDRCIAVYNHISMFDGFILTACIHPFSFVINSNQGSLGVLKHVVRKLHYVIVDYTRGGGQTAKITSHVSLPDSNMLAIAPEGTTSNGAALLRFRSGAFVPLRPVLPVLIRSARRPLSQPALYAVAQRWRRRSAPQRASRLARQPAPLRVPAPCPFGSPSRRPGSRRPQPPHSLCHLRSHGPRTASQTREPARISAGRSPAAAGLTSEVHGPVAAGTGSGTTTRPGPSIRP